MHVLVVDDHPQIRFLAAQFLLSAGYTVTEAENGLEAVQQAVCHRPDVIVLDGNMPILDGWTACQRIKALTSIPVVMLTVHAEPADYARATACGADGYVTKPFDADVLLAAVAKLVALPARP